MFDKATNLFPAFEPTLYRPNLANKKEPFKNSDSFEIEISDHHTFTVAALKSQPLTGNVNTKLYRDYSSFSYISSTRN